MAMDYLNSLTTLFGADAVITGEGPDAVLSFKPAQTGAAGFVAPERARPEALLLALLQTANAAQGITNTRAMELSKTAVIATKDGDQVTGEQYTVRIFSASALTALDPDAL
jgi:hypothetical protein